MTATWPIWHAAVHCNVSFVLAGAFAFVKVKKKKRRVGECGCVGREQHEKYVYASVHFFSCHMPLGLGQLAVAVFCYYCDGRVVITGAEVTCIRMAT